MTTPSQRSAAVDAVRVLGIAFVVAAHVWGSGVFGKVAYAWHVPVFFFLTGWLWKSGRTMRMELLNRLRTIGVPYVTWAIIIAIPFVLRHQQPVGEVLRHLAWGGNHLQRPWYAFWFVGTLFVTCLARRALDRFGLWTITAIAVAGLVVAYLLGERLANTPLEAGMVFAALPFVVAGEWAARISRTSIPARGVVGFVMIAAPLAIVVTTPVDVFNLKYGRLGTPVLAYLIAVAIGWGLVLVGQAIERHVTPGIRHATTTLGSVGLLVVLAHGVALWLIPSPWIALAVGVVGCWAFALTIRRTALAWVLIGWPSLSERSSPRHTTPSSSPTEARLG